jgi:acetolactate decarboxylase
MKNVMRKGELAGRIQLDSIASRPGSYGLGPLEYLQGELLLFDGKVYVSKVSSDTTMSVFENPQAKAPFFVYGQVANWKAQPMPDSIHNIPQLEAYLLQTAKDPKQAFAFRLQGTVASAQIHIQNLPAGTKVSSPEEAHQGQVNYDLKQQTVDLLGFFSTQHRGIFTHHDRYVHLHLLTKDRKQMGHLDAVHFTNDQMELLLPVD